MNAETPKPIGNRGNRSFLTFKKKRKESKLKTMRRQCGLTQEELSGLSGVALPTIRAYERKAKDINKAQMDIVMGLADALKCEIRDLIG